MLRMFGLILTTTLLTVLLLQKHVSAQSTANLQADVNNLRLQVSQLQSEVAQIRSQRGIPSSVPAPSSSRRARSPELNDTQIVDRLAILAIEAKDRLNALERRVTNLEARLKK